MKFKYIQMFVNDLGPWINNHNNDLWSVMAVD